MDICFKVKKLEKIFNSQSRLNRIYGSLARTIMERMAVLKGARNLSQVPRTSPPRCHQLRKNRDEDFAVDLKHPYRLVFRSQHSPVPRKEDGGIDTKNITAIEIVEIIDYH